MNAKKLPEQNDSDDLDSTLAQLAERMPLSIIYDVVRIETGEIDGRWALDTAGARGRLWVYLYV